MSRDDQEGAHDAAIEPGAPLDAAAALAGSVAHDLGNMLTVVLGNAELLVEGLAGQPDLAELAALILGAAQRGTELTGRLDRFARRIPPPAVPTDTEAVLARFARRISAGLPPDVQLELAVPQGLRPVALPTAALLAALDEIAANALAALGGRGRLRILASNDAAPSGEGRVRLAIEDDGIGMETETLRRSRELRFSSGIAGHKTGLGLALATRVALAGGGRLLIESVSGRGTRVTLDLVAAS